MFDKAIIDTDKFMDLPMSAKALYFLLGMEADDEGFVSYKKVIRIHGGNDDDIKILIVKEFLIEFPTGVVVITDWQKNNYLDKNRVSETEYQNEKSNLSISKGKYVLAHINIDVKQKLNKCSTSIEQNRIEQNRIDTISNDIEQAHGNEDINWLIGEFERVMLFKSAGTKDRFMAKHLLRTFTREQLTAMLTYCSTEKYAPRIGSVEKLWFKRGEILAGIKSLSQKPLITKL